MAPIEHEYEIALFQQLYVVLVVHCSGVCRTFAVDGRQKVHRHHAACMKVVIVVERLGQHASVRFIDVAQRISRIHDLIHPCVDSLVQIVFLVQNMNLNGISNVIRNSGEALREFLRWIFIQKGT